MAVPSTPAFVMNFTANNQSFVVLEKLWAQREKGQFCDIVLHVKGQKFEAHKNVLAACSPYFESLLKTHCTNDELLIICQSLEAFHYLLKFLYTGTVAIDETIVSELLVLACHFDLENLKNYCMDYLKECMDVSNCMTVMEMAIEYGLPDLRKYVEDFTLENIVEINGHLEFLAAGFQKIKSFLDAVNTIIPQYILLDFICKWVGHNVNNRVISFKDLLEIVNWQCVECKFLENLIQTCPLFQKGSKCLDTLFSCLEEKDVDLTLFQDAFNRSSIQEHSGCSIESKNPDIVAVNNSSDATADLFKALPVSAHSENDSLKVINHLPMQLKKSINNATAVANSTVSQTAEIIDASILVVEKQQKLNHPLFSEESGLFINNELSVFQPNNIKSEGEKTINKTPISEPSENLNVLAEATELFSSYNKRKIILSGASSGNVSVTPHVTPVKALLPISPKKTVERPAIHYLSRTPLANKKDNDIRVSLTQECNSELSEVKLLGMPEIEDMSANDSQSSNDSFYDDLDQTCDLDESNVSSDMIIPKAESLQSEDSNMNSNNGSNPVVLDVSASSKAPPQKKLKLKERSIRSKDSVKYCLEVDDKGNLIPKLDKQQTRRQRIRLKWQKGVKCESCSFIAHSYDTMQDHLESFHGKDITNRCTICDFTCKRRRKFTNHVRTHFPGPPFHCEVCDYTSNKFHRLLTHRTLHSGERPYKCNLCTYQSLTKSSLDYHMRGHTGEKPYVCGVCQHAFAKKCTLEQHSLKHESGRKYACDKCDFTAKYKSQFIIHQRIHRGFVFRCEFEGCDYSTPAKHCYRAHRRMHMNDRPYLCQTCGKSFIESGMLVRHERVHMDVRLFFHCEHCEYMTRRRDGLKEHMKKYHSENSKSIYKPRKSHNASSENDLTGKQQASTKKTRLPVKRKYELQEAISTISQNEENIITPLFVADDEAHTEQEIVLVTSSLSEGQGPVTFLQILPTSAYETVPIEGVTDDV